MEKIFSGLTAGIYERKVIDMARKKKEVEAVEEVKDQIDPKTEEKKTDIAYRVVLSDPKSFLNIRKQPDITQAELALALGLSVKGIEKIIRQLKDANAIRRIGGKKMGSWEVVA